MSANWWWVAAATLLVLPSSVAFADTWEQPTKETYYSPDGEVRITVIPRELESALSYFKDKVDRREPAGAPAGTQATSATAILERRNPSGQWQRIWTRPLVNEVAPVDVVLANNSQGFATFDNWHSTGFGPDAIAIYNREGALVRQLALTDLFPNWFVAALPRSVSSIHWRGEPRISADGAELIVPIIQPSAEELSFRKGKTIDFAIRLADGAPVGLEQPRWKRALAQAASTARQSCAAQRKAIQEWNAPISAPKTNKEQAWHHYLRETQFRTKWTDDLSFPSTTVLRPRNAADYEASLKWLEEALTEPGYLGDVRTIGSPDAGNLAAEIERIARNIALGQLEGVEFAIVSNAKHADRIRRALAHSGATLTIIDPAREIPQVNERIQNQADLVICEANQFAGTRANWFHALPFILLGGGVFMLRRL